MLIVLKAKGCADVIMLEANGRQILSLLGKDPMAAEGIVTVEQLPVAMVALRRAVEVERTSVAQTAPEKNAGNAPDPDALPSVRLFQRAQPVLALLAQALQAGTPVTWGT